MNTMVTVADKRAAGDAQVGAVWIKPRIGIVLRRRVGYLEATRVDRKTVMGTLLTHTIIEIACAFPMRHTQVSIKSTGGIAAITKPRVIEICNPVISAIAIDKDPIPVARSRGASGSITIGITAISVIRQWSEYDHAIGGRAVGFDRPADMELTAARALDKGLRINIQGNVVIHV